MKQIKRNQKKQKKRGPWLFICLFLVIGLVLGMSMFAFIKIYMRSDPQIDHLRKQILGRLRNFVDITLELGNIRVQSRPNDKINVLFHSKQIFKNMPQTGFLLLMQNFPIVESKNDSFYHLRETYKNICNQQIITHIFQSKNKQQKMKSLEQIVIQGYFENCKNSNYTITLKQNESTKNLQIQVNLTSEEKQAYNRIQIKFADLNDSIYYGMGAQHSYLSLGRGRSYTNLVRQKGVGRSSKIMTFLVDLFRDVSGNYHNSYSPAPIWISNKKLGFIINSYAYLSWTSNRVRIWDRNASIIIISKDNYKDIVSEIAKVNGYVRQIPQWVNRGAIVGLQGGSQKVVEKYNYLKSFGAKITGLWLQDWSGKRQCKNGGSRLWWNWELDDKYYSKWTEMKNKLTAENVNLLIYFNPHFVDPSQKSNYHRNYHKEIRQGNFGIKLNNNNLFETSSINDFTSLMIDFENNQAVQFYESVIERGINETGAMGMMVDFGQAYPIQNMGHNIQQALREHNRYPTVYQQKFHNFLQRKYGKDNKFYTFTRSSGLNSPRYAYSMWAGDQTMDFDFHNGMPSCVKAMLSSGLIGFSNTHCDIGGYIYLGLQSIGFSLSERTDQLMIKWMQLGAFSPVFRTHQGNNPKQLQVYSNPFLGRYFAFYSNIFAILAHYRSEQTKKSKEQLLPLIRTLFLQHPDNDQVAQISDQFYLGEQMLVSPHLQKGKEKRYYLPKGSWTDIWNGRQIQGCDCYRQSVGMLPPVYINSQSSFKKQITQSIQKLISQFQETQDSKKVKQDAQL